MSHEGLIDLIQSSDDEWFEGGSSGQKTVRHQAIGADGFSHREKVSWIFGFLPVREI
jgi:hypothetical protein